MQNQTLLKLRKNWFNLKAKEFISRYSMGLLTLVFFLPGVGVGENFSMLMQAISKPFLLVSQLDSLFLNKLYGLFILITVFVVWARAQRQAINGGQFTLFLQTMPIKESDKVLMNIKMLLISNHFLWVLVCASYYFISITDNNVLTLFCRNTYALILLLLIQYIFVFKANIKNVLSIIGLCFIFIVNVSPSYEALRMIVSALLMLAFVCFVMFKEQSHRYSLTRYLLLSRLVNKSFYLQILFKSGLTSSLFRVAIIVGLFIGFILAVDYWVKDYSELTPYYLALEAVLAYFVSGFYVSFLDQRTAMNSWLITLPTKKHFWFVRDNTAVLLLTVLLHLPFYFWALQLSSIALLINVFIYHLILLVVCYPIRTLVKDKQTFITFVVLFIITAITIFNLP